MKKATILWLKSIIFWLIVSVFLGLFLKQAYSQVPPECMERKVLVQILADRYDEHLVRVHIDENTKLRVELFKDEETGTWTIIAVNSENLACVIKVGEDDPANPAPMSYTL